MPQSVIPPTCTHERRPGTTTCLYCLQEERARAASRRKRLLLRVMAGVGGVAALVALAIVGVSRIGTGDTVAPSAATSDSGDATPTPAASTPAARAPRRQALEPVIASGSRSLGEGVVATRTNDEIVVNFDTDLLRTRFDWKFEAVVRSTLPRVYGETVRVALDSVPNGTLVRGDIVGELAERGIPIALPGARADTVMVWPVTRPGRDGPIVVAYRAESR